MNLEGHNYFGHSSRRLNVCRPSMYLSWGTDNPKPAEPHESVLWPSTAGETRAAESKEDGYGRSSGTPETW